MTQPSPSHVALAWALALLAPTGADAQLPHTGSLREVFPQPGSEISIDAARVEGAIAELADALRAARSTAARLPASPERDAITRQLDDADASLEALLRAVDRAGPAERRVRVIIEPPPAPPPPTPPLLRPANGAQHASVLQGVEGAPASADKLRVLRAASDAHRFTTAQVTALVSALDSDTDKVEALAILHGTLTDPENTHTLYALLGSPAHREALEKRLRGDGQP